MYIIQIHLLAAVRILWYRHERYRLLYWVLLFLTFTDSFIAHSTEETCICTAFTAVKACIICKVLYL